MTSCNDPDKSTTEVVVVDAVVVVATVVVASIFFETVMVVVDAVVVVVVGAAVVVVVVGAAVVVMVVVVAVVVMVVVVAGRVQPWVLQVSDSSKRKSEHGFPPFISEMRTALVRVDFPELHGLEQGLHESQSPTMQSIAGGQVRMVQGVVVLVVPGLCSSSACSVTSDSNADKGFTSPLAVRINLERIEDLSSSASMSLMSPSELIEEAKLNPSLL